MKKVIMLILALSLSIIMVSCNKDNKETQDNQETEKENKEYAIYLGNTYSYDPLTLESNENTKVKVSPEQKQFYLSKSEPLEKDENTPDTFVYNIGADEITCKFDKIYEMGVKKLNRYVSEDPVTIDIDISAGEIVFLSSNVERYEKDGNLSEEQANKIAEETICKLYGSNILNEYKRQPTIMYQNTNCYAVCYSKYVHGMLTNDDIEIGVNMKGEVVTINAYYKGTLAGIENEVSQKDIEDALLAVEEYFGDKWTIDDYKQIVSDSQGDYYICTFVYRIVDGARQSETIYINIS